MIDFDVKEGDTLTVINEEQFDNLGKSQGQYPGGFLSSMLKEFGGKKVTIREISPDKNIFYLLEDKQCWNWSKPMFVESYTPEELGEPSISSKTFSFQKGDKVRIKLDHSKWKTKAVSQMYKWAGKIATIEHINEHKDLFYCSIAEDLAWIWNCDDMDKIDSGYLESFKHEVTKDNPLRVGEVVLLKPLKKWITGRNNQGLMDEWAGQFVTIDSVGENHFKIKECPGYVWRHADCLRNISAIKWFDEVEKSIDKQTTHSSATAVFIDSLPILKTSTNTHATLNESIKKLEEVWGDTVWPDPVKESISETKVQIVFKKPLLIKNSL